jgi:membrane protease YdiL (CAAX protease family)
MTSSISNIPKQPNVDPEVIDNEPLNQPGISPLFEKIILTGSSVYMMFGGVPAICAVVGLAALSYISNQSKSSSWFPIKNMYEHISNAFPDIFWALCGNVSFGVFMNMVNIKNSSLPCLILKESFLKGKKAFAYVVIKTGILSPIVDEILFRGFLQDCIKNIQATIWKVNENETEKKCRVIAQSIIYAIGFFNPAMGIQNIYFVGSALWMGFYLGMKRENVNTLWAPFASNSIYRITNIARIVMLGA